MSDNKYYVYYSNLAGQNISKKFPTLAQGLDFCRKNNIVPLLRKLPNASLITNVDADAESKLKKLKISYLKQPYEAAPLESNLEYGKAKSVIVSVNDEYGALSNLPMSRVFSRFYEPRFALKSTSDLAFQAATNGDSEDQNFIHECKAILKKLDSDPSILSAILEESSSDLNEISADNSHLFCPEDHLASYDMYKEDSAHQTVKLEGLGFDIENVDSIIRLRSLLPQGYTAYLYSSYFPKLLRHPDQVPPGIIYMRRAVVCKSISDDDFVKFRCTQAANYNLFNSQIREKLSQWKKLFGAELLGAKNDSLDIKFDTTRIQDIDELTKELIEFCPEIVSQSSEEAGTEQTKASLSSDGLINLWWD